MAALIESVEHLANRPATRAGSVGFSLRFLTDPAEEDEEAPVGSAEPLPEPALEHLGDKSLLPASTLKTITTGCALAILGEDYRFATVLQHDGAIDEETGELDGNIFIKGSGDPTLAEDGWTSLFDEWLAVLREAGIKRIAGHVVGDGSVFATQAVSGAWAWDDIGNYYAPAVTGLNFCRNTFQISFQPGAVGSAARLVGTHPKVPGLELINEMRTGATGSGDRGYVYGAPYAETYYLRGSIPKQSKAFSIKGAFPDPAYVCSDKLAAHLLKNGVEVGGGGTTVRRAGFESKGERHALHTHRSVPLVDLVQPVNHKSLNLDAEALLKAIGRKRFGNGTTTDGAMAVIGYLKREGVDTSGFDMTDGCGLSRGNAVSPNQLTAALSLFSRQGESLRKSLPIAGRSGTLKAIGGGTPAEGRVRAKSGTVHRTKCYAGYVDCRSGRKAAFAVMVNRYTGSYPPIKAGLTAILARLAEM